MASVGVIRKEVQQVLTPSGFQMQYAVGQSNSSPQLVQGQNPQGMAGLQQNPMTQQMEATPQMDASGKNEVGVYQGDKYGAGAVNQMSRRKLKEGETRSIDAGNEAFDRGSRWGQTAHGVGQGLSAVAGVLGAGVSLANAGAQGQDAFSGGMNALQMGQVAQETVKKPLTEGLGNAAANLAGRSVGVTKPVVAPPTPQVASATPFNQTETRQTLEDELRTKEGALRHNNPANLPGYEQRVGVLQHRLAPNTSVGVTAENPSGEFNPTVAPGSMDMFTPPQYTGTVPFSPDQQMLPGFPPGAPLKTTQVKVAPATTSTMTDDTAAAAIGAETGQGQLPGAPDPNADSAAAAEIKANTLAAKETDTEASMASQGHAKKMVGVSGSKRMVGVY